jgi:hypothetical protein
MLFTFASSFEPLIRYASIPFAACKKQVHEPSRAFFAGLFASAFIEEGLFHFAFRSLHLN